jgi:N-acetylglucosaminyldiphosphoundecaprenol N-acetyl-beta-D-mannosaminyltransferase
MGVGCVFDLLAGSARRAPRWMQRAGLEWSYRLYKEPRRLWKRYVLGIPRFLLGVLRHPPRAL